LITDFGAKDPFVGELKLVILRLAPGTAIVDVTHGIAAGAVREGAWVLRQAWRNAPEGSCHLAVVDPGVGGERRGLAARAGGQLFVGPDNGLLAPALEEAGIESIHEIAWRETEHRRAGTTFDGRDVFAPVVARLLRGASLREVGPEIDDPIPMAPYRPAPLAEGGHRVEVIRVDRFGNIVTVAEESFLRETFGQDWRDVGIEVDGAEVRGIRLGYSEVAAGQLLLSIGGSGTLELSVRDGSARQTTGIRAGSFIRLLPPSR
jgi:S-adenosylmethionine hydrolase